MTTSGPSSQVPASSGPTRAAQEPTDRRWRLLPFTRQDGTITCYDYLGRPKSHGPEQRYVSPTTGVCRGLIVQSVVRLRGPHERTVSDNTGQASKLALWLVSTNPFDPDKILEWIWIWFMFNFRFSASVLLLVVQPFLLLFGISLSQERNAYNVGTYKSFPRNFTGQLWEARSKMEYSTRTRDEDQEERNIVTRSLYPRLLMIRNTAGWSPCTEPGIIQNKRYLAISYCASDLYSPGPYEMTEKEAFKTEVRLAAIELDYDAYWCDLECIGETPDEKNLDVYCMADVYRGAESTLIILGNSEEGEKAAWKRWGERVWTLPEALLSQHLLYKFRDKSKIDTISLRQMANIAYSRNDSERAVINAYSGKDPLDRLERLSLLKSAMWRRGIRVASKPTPLHPESISLSTDENTLTRAGPHAAERVYALMGFFGHRIQPNYAESELRALARLSMANDSDRIAERMVSMLPRKNNQEARWYADDDIYDANIWDIVPEIQVAGITDSGALVIDGCRAAAIRWKNFPSLAFNTTNSMRRSTARFMAYLAWPIIIAGVLLLATIFQRSYGITVTSVGVVLLLASPRLLVFGQSGRVIGVQPWFIGVKGVMSADVAAEHLYGGGMAGHFQRVHYPPSGSEFAVPKRGSKRGGSKEQYKKAIEAQSKGAQIFTLVDTYAASVYYFRAARPPTVCLFTGREGGLGRYVLCSERCKIGELHKETVLRMPTSVSEKMRMHNWIALG